MHALRFWIGTSLVIALSPFHVSAQSGSSINGPSLGFLSNSNGTTLWPLLGILGASVPGPPLALPESVTNAAISPLHNYAVAISASTGQPVIIHLDSSSPVSASLEGARANPGLIAISPSGTGVALYDKNSRVLQFVSGLPSSPQIIYELDLSAVGNDVRDIAVSDDAALALVLAGNESRTLWSIQGNGAMSPVSAIRPSQITFIAHRPDALVADDGTQEVFLLQSLDQAPVRLPGVVLPEGERPFSAIAGSSDGRWIYVAQDGFETISIVDLQTRQITELQCQCKPTVIFPLKGTSVFRLNGLSSGPINVLDASPSNPRTLFIPIDPSLLAGETEQ